MSFASRVLTHFQLPFYLLGKILPRPIQNSFYYVPFVLLKNALSKFQGELWYRNSFYFGDIVFGISDLDLTFYGEQPLSQGQKLALTKIVSFYKVFFPHIGEVAIYSSEQVKKISSCFNPIELSRDPLLAEKLRNQGLVPSRMEIEDKVAFSLNWLKSDLHKMKYHFKRREKKIRRFLHLLGVRDINSDSPLPKNFDELLDLLVTSVWKEINDLSGGAFYASLRKILSIGLRDFNQVNNLYQENKEDQTFRMVFCALYPQLWMGPAILLKKEKEDLHFLKKAPRLLLRIFEKQVCWEVWGLYSQQGQYLEEKERINLFLHIESLLNLLTEIEETPMKHVIIKALKSIKESEEERFSGEGEHVCS